MTSTPPSPEVAYAAAPPLHLEADELMRLRPSGLMLKREWLLRHAAFSDRQTVDADPADGKAQTAALRPIQKLLAFDIEHGTTAGPIGPDNDEWADFPRGYVRQEYLAWQGEQGADIAQILPRRRSDGELYRSDDRRVFAP